MNIFECRNGSQNGFDCLFNLTKKGCLKCAGKQGHDTYNLYPEIEGSNPLENTSGDVVYQPSNPGDPYKIGDMLAFENLTGHQNGRNFDLRYFDADIHPLYNQIEYNVPIHKSEFGSLIPILEKDLPGDIFGDNPTLVHSGWNETRFIGASNVEYCKGINGKFNSFLGYVSHTCIKEHYTPDWNNFGKKDIPIKQLYIAYSDHKNIIDYLSKFIVDKKKILRLTRGLRYATKNYINLYILFKNNDVDTSILKNISTESIDSIYKTNYPLQKLCELYNYLCKSDLNRKTINKLKVNLLNYILNSPILKNLEIEDRKYEPNERYWFVIPLIKNAYKEGLINKNKILPDYLIKIFRTKVDFQVKVFKDLFNYSDIKNYIKNDILDSMIYNTDGYKKDGKLQNKTDLYNNLYPEMINISEYLNDKLSTIKGVESIKVFILGQFTEILKIGKKWTLYEIRETFDIFLDSYIKDDPSIFYNWINDLSESLDKCYELNFTSSRIFIINILMNSLDYQNWDSWDDFNTVKVPLNNWYETNARKQILRECQHETFWSNLVLVKKGKCVEREDYEEIYENYVCGVASTSSSIQAGLDESDYRDYDPTTGESHLTNEKEGSSWTEE